jgi:hypothetical protein
LQDIFAIGGGLPAAPSIPSVPGVPNVPDVPGVPDIPSIPGIPGIPQIDNTKVGVPAMNKTALAPAQLKRRAVQLARDWKDGNSEFRRQWNDGSWDNELRLWLWDFDICRLEWKEGAQKLYGKLNRLWRSSSGTVHGEREVASGNGLQRICEEHQIWVVIVRLSYS